MELLYYTNLSGIIKTHDTMKHIFSIFALFLTGVLFSQIAIGKSSVTNTSVSLEFGSGNRGLILPWVFDASTMTNAEPGTLVFDTTDKKIKYKKNLNLWQELTFNVSHTYNGVTLDTTGSVDLSAQIGIEEKTNAKVIIGSNPSAETAPGILVLSDTNKAMILPKVASPHLNIINPSPGMVVYDTVKNMLCVFNGTVWTFWKP